MSTRSIASACTSVNSGARSNNFSFAVIEPILACAAAALALLTLLFAFLLPSAALAAPGPPIVSGTSFAEVTGTSARLEAKVNPNSRPVQYHFEYITRSGWVEDHEAFGEGTASSPSGSLPAGAEPVAISAEVTALAPATAYRFRLFAENSKKEIVIGEEVTFATYPAAPIFGPCGNEAFRDGEFSPPARPSALLPDCRAYEQVTPTDKDGGDSIQNAPVLRASPDGDAVTYGTGSGLPGGLGAQSPPLFRADRTAGGWTGTGVLPPGAEAPVAQVAGWLPDLSLFFVNAARPGPPETSAMLATGAGPTRQVTPFAPGLREGYSYAGSSADGSEAFLEHEGDVYVWDRGAGTLTLASRLNSDAETQTGLPKGAFAGPYDWIAGRTGEGGAGAGFYMQEVRAVGEDGSLIFTASGSGRIYERLNPTEPQSTVVDEGGPDEECTEPEKACTLEVSADHRPEPDPAGQAPAAFQVASADGRTSFFTSSQKLTGDANTGPEVEPSAIGRATLQGEGKAKEELPELLPGVHAVGVAIDPSGEHVYWADPAKGTIGRARLDAGGDPVPGSEDDEYVSREQIEVQREVEPGVTEGLSAPRYVAVDAGHVYWTNATDGGKETGTIGRAKLGADKAEEPRPECIKGASNPQGIAVDAGNIYWANAFRSDEEGIVQGIGRAGIGCGAPEQEFFDLGSANAPQGLAVDGGHIYFAVDGTGLNTGSAAVERIPLGGGGGQFIGVGEGARPRGIALDGTHLYWAAQGLKAIGRLPLSDFSAADPLCTERPGCEPEFLKLNSSLAGLALDPGAEHLFWSANGEIPPNPGTDLYRFQAAGAGGCQTPEGCLTDITADPADEDGAEVQGVLGASADGSRLYFVADAVLATNTVEGGAGPEQAEPGSCNGSLEKPKGECNLYLWEAGGGAAGSISFIARLDSSGTSASSNNSDALDWATRPLFVPNRAERTSRLTPSGDALLLRSQRRLTAYDNQGTPEYYLYRPGRPLTCLTCNPTGAPPTSAPTLGSVKVRVLGVSNSTAAVSSRNLAADGRRLFFESDEALVAADTDGAGGCEKVDETLLVRTCQDVYEWEAPGAGSCEAGVPPYSPAVEGCLYLLSSGGESEPSYFLDASASGEDAFILTRGRLVGQDTDALLDVYDARVGGGLAAQDPPPGGVCGSAEACRPAATPAPDTPAPVTPGVQGGGNVKQAPRCAKGKVRRHGRCVKKLHGHKNQHRRPGKHKKHRSR